MGESDLLEMLAVETHRRMPAIIDGITEVSGGSEPNPTAIEEIRVEVHGLKGAAGVVGQTRLAELALAMEVVLVQRIASGLIDETKATALIDGANALHDGAKAAAVGNPEPESVAASIAALAPLAED